MNENSKVEYLISTIIDNNGRISNLINYPKIGEVVLGNLDQIKSPDIYFAFLIKTMVDDFGETLVNITNGKVNKEQFEAQFIEDLKWFLAQKTKLEE